MAQVSFRIDEDLKQRAERALDEMGLTMSAAITVFLTKVARERRIPFEISAAPSAGRTPAAIGSLTKEHGRHPQRAGVSGRRGRRGNAKRISDAYMNILRSAYRSRKRLPVRCARS